MLNRAHRSPLSRRKFVQTASAAAAATFAAPYVVGQDKSDSPAIIGEGEYRYQCIHGWGELPDKYAWRTTHNIAVDSEGLVYIKHYGAGNAVQPTIYVFDEKGKFVRAFGEMFHVGGHGIDIREENGEEFLYLCDNGHHLFAKMDRKGELVWKKSFPEECGKYENANRFTPTNIAFAPNGDFYVADGYGSHYIHQYDKDANWIRTWGGPGKEDGQFQTPHGIWLDNRPSRQPMIVVADRANARLQYFSLDGKYIMKLEGVLSFPAHFDTRGDVLMVPDLHARITLLDAENNVIVHLGDDPEWTRQVLDGFKMRNQPDTWKPGKFIHPHDACFDEEGNIFVAEWVGTGRISKLKKMG